VPFPKEDMEIVLAKFKNIDSDSFVSLFFLFRFVCSKMPLPIPRKDCPFGDFALECNKRGVRYSNKISVVEQV